MFCPPLRVGFTTVFSVALLVGCADVELQSQDQSMSGSFKSRSNCGVVVNQKLKNPPAFQDGLQVRITKVIDGEFLIVEGSVPMPVKLLVKTLGAESTGKQGAAGYLQRIGVLGRPVTFYHAGESCNVITDDGGQGSLGTIVLADGQVLTEKLIAAGYLRPDSVSDYCGSGLVEGCYAALPPQIEVSAQTISNFLWKPVGDRDGRLVVLFSPGNATVTVNGETLENSGPSNGRGTTARGKRPGCAYGRAIVKATDSLGRVISFPGGQHEYVIENGCRRVEFQS